MKYFFKYLSEIEKKIKKRKIAILLDFDLTLSPLVKNPNQAYLPKKTKVILKNISDNTPVAIVTGRSLKDIKNKVGIKKILYYGNHGMEYESGNTQGFIHISREQKEALTVVKKDLIKKYNKIPEIIFEDKKFSIALGYRLMKKKEIIPFESFLKEYGGKIIKQHLLCVRLDKKTFEIYPKSKINKGSAVISALKKMSKKSNDILFPIYVGDGLTDEDAFKALAEKGVTIRVHKNKTSNAEWYLKNQKEVYNLLKWFITISEKKYVDQ